MSFGRRMVLLAAALGYCVATGSAGAADAVAIADASSPGFSVHAKVVTGTVAVQDAQGIFYSTAWQSAVAEASTRSRISVRRADGTGAATVLLDQAGPCAGTVSWDAAVLVSCDRVRGIRGRFVPIRSHGHLSSRRIPSTGRR